MNLKERRCPNCGGNEIFERDGTFVCMNCRTFFDDANDVKITQTQIIRDEAELEKIRYAKEKDKSANRWIWGTLIVLVAFLIWVWSNLKFE